MAFASLFDSLYCPEEHLDLYQEPDDEQQQQVVLDDDLAELFAALGSKEAETWLPRVVGEQEDGYGGPAGRAAAVGWAARAVARLGFSALTAALAAAYLDRCFLGGALRLGSRPWMARLAAVACVALAAKVEETRVPLLLDLQLFAAGDSEAGAGEDDGYVFEAKTVRRMELLVLSALNWRMHPVTPLSYLQPLLGGGGGGGGGAASAVARLRRCENALLAVMADWRWARYRPSAWAAAALLGTEERGDDDTEFLALVNAPKEEVEECYQIISKAMGIDDSCNGSKRKRAAFAHASLHSPPPSPSGVIGAAACFSCESSSSSACSDSWAAWPASVSSSPEARPYKRAAGQHCIASQMLFPDEESREAWPSS